MLTNHSDDPHLHVHTNNGRLSHWWTGGNYTFKILMQTGSTGHLEQRSGLFIAHPTQLFDIVFVKRPAVWVPILRRYLYGYFPEFTGFRTINNIRIPLINWNLAQFEPTIKISIAKENPTRTETTTVSREVQFAGNVNMDFKFGLRFGGTVTDRRTVTSQIVTRIDDIDLGGVFVNFGDMVVLGQQGNTWRLREHRADSFAITVKPYICAT